MLDSFRVEHEDLSQKVYRTLKRMILIGELKTGEKLRQDKLAERLGVSRTPLLSAFSKLEKEMLVETVPRRGAFVRKYRLDELVDIYEIRVRLEPLGAAQAAKNGTDDEIAKLNSLSVEFGKMAASRSAQLKELDYEYHMLIMKMSRNELLYNIISSYSIIPIANVYGFFKEPTASSDEHTALSQAITNRDASGARRQMFQHIDSSRRHLLRRLETEREGLAAQRSG
jgi:DNA-binding GntR family transcriptional regulator